MQNLRQFFLSIMCLAITTFNARAQQDFTGMPGDNFSLQGALEMFKQASSPEEFEKLINSADKNVNNLDLNGDGDIDYIKVIDKTDNQVHAFILQVAVTETENQDIAVIELEKTGDTTAVLQIVGDEDIFGEEVIVESSEEGDEEMENNNNGLRRGPGADYYESNRIVVNVFFWPSVRFVYRPVYVPWVSPWRWHHYPGWWRPWRPLAWKVYHPGRLYYNRHCAIVHTHRVVAAHRVYTPCRVSSVTVRTRTTVARINYQGTRTATYTRVSRAGGNNRVSTAQNNRVQKRGNNGYRKGRKD
jgi:hypothetical protein